MQEIPDVSTKWNNEMYLNFLYLEVQKNEIENIERSLMCYTTRVCESCGISETE